MTYTLDRVVSVVTFLVAFCAYLPLFAWLELLPKAVFIACSGAALLNATGRLRLSLPAYLLNLAGFAALAWYGMKFSRSNPVQPVVSMLVIMLAIRMIGELGSRQIYQISALSLFCLASVSLYDLSISFIAYLLAALLLIPLLLVLVTVRDCNRPVPAPIVRKAVFMGVLLPVLAVPLIFLFFPILPRTQLPLWNFLNPAASAATGYSDRVEPGRAASVTSNRIPVFRATGPELPQKSLYWRVSVFDRLEGNRWRRSDAVPSEKTSMKGKPVAYELVTETSSSGFVPALDTPLSVSLPRSKQLPDHVWAISPGGTAHRAYRAVSVPEGIIGGNLLPDESHYLGIPEKIPQKILAEIETIRKSSSSDRERVSLLEDFFRKAGLRYSNSGLPTGSGAIGDFLFVSRKGNCEFFASSFALMLRGAGIPSRLVGGYLGGDYNPVGGYYLVTENMAHVWVEAFLRGVGWIRIDPVAFAANADSVWLDRKSHGFLMKMRLTMDLFNHYWNTSVVSYDFERQFEAARNAEQRIRRFEPGRIRLSWLLLPVAVSALLWLWLRFFRRRTSREDRILKRFLEAMVRDCGIRREKWMGLYDIAELSGCPDARRFVDVYAGAVYRDRRLSDHEFRILEELVGKGFSEPPRQDKAPRCA